MGAGAWRVSPGRWLCLGRRQRALCSASPDHLARQTWPCRPAPAPAGSSTRPGGAGHPGGAVGAPPEQRGSPACGQLSLRLRSEPRGRAGGRLQPRSCSGPRALAFLGAAGPAFLGPEASSPSAQRQVGKGSGDSAGLCPPVTSASAPRIRGLPGVQDRGQSPGGQH